MAQQILTIQPLNTEWNRKAQILDGAGTATWLGSKNGDAYFTWTDIQRGTTYLKCEGYFFLKNFHIPAGHSGVPDLAEIPNFEKIKFLKYPFDMIAGAKGK